MASRTLWAAGGPARPPEQAAYRVSRIRTLLAGLQLDDVPTLNEPPSASPFGNVLYRLSCRTVCT